MMDDIDNRIYRLEDKVDDLINRIEELEQQLKTCQEDKAELVKGSKKQADRLNNAISGNHPRFCMEEVEKDLRALADEYEVKE